MLGRASTLLALTLLLLVGRVHARQPSEIPEGSGGFRFIDEDGRRARAITVWTYRPPNLSPSARVVFVMHGMNRDARRYRDQWQPHAEALGFLLLVPELGENFYSTRAYQRGNVVDDRGAPLPPREWTFGVVERVFDAARRDLRLRASTYAIYGHSAGAQFVHRLVLFAPDSRFSVAIAANSGWYTMPTFSTEFPYGLGGAPATNDTLRRALGKDLVVLIGEDDTDPTDEGLRTTERAQAQGRTRFDRAESFYRAAQEAAGRLRVPLRWRRIIVPDAAHSNRAMAEAAARLLR